MPDSRRPAATRLACVGIPVLTVAVALAVKSYLASTINRLVFLGAIGQALMLPLLGAAALYFLHCKSDPRLNPRVVWIAFVWISVVLISSLGIYATGVQLGLWAL